jgi:hypothetical protein
MDVSFYLEIPGFWMAWLLSAEKLVDLAHDFWGYGGLALVHLAQGLADLF